MSTSTLSHSVHILLVLLLGIQAAAQDKDLDILPSYTTPAVAFSLSLDKHTVVIGETFTYSFRSSQDGYVSLWDIGTSARVVRLYPNRYQKDMRVRAGQDYGAGGPAATFALQATGPIGIEDIYALWTRTPQGQPIAEHYDNVSAFRQALQGVERLRSNDRATAKVALNIGSPAPPEAVRPGLLTANFKTAYLLAMGANVGELARANDDARYFAATMTYFLRLPAEQVRVVENARVKDFADGLAWLRTQAGLDDLAIVYFSGHGSTVNDNNNDEADGKDEVFVMYDVQEHPTPLAEHVIRDDQFAAWLHDLRARQVLVFIDACFGSGLYRDASTMVTNARSKFLSLAALEQGAGPLATSVVWPDLPGGIDRHTNRSGEGPQLVVLAAAQEQQQALELYQGSLFTLTFLATLQQARDQDLPSLFRTVTQRVEQVSKRQQTPALVGDTAVAATFRVR